MASLGIDLDKLIQQIELDLPDESPLAKVTEAQQRARLLTEIGDQLIDYFVAAAREIGAPWSQVGDALGVTKQAAQQKWMPSIFQRFTDRSRAVIVAAQERARAVRHDAVAPAHLLLALADSDGLSAALLADRGITTQALHDALGDALHPGTARPPATMPFTISAKRVLDAAAMAAVDLGHNFIGTEHVLLGLFGAADPATGHALTALHLTEDDLRADVARRLQPTPQTDA